MKFPTVTFLVTPLSGLKYIHPAGRPPRPASTAEALSPRRPHPRPRAVSAHVATPGTPRGWQHTVLVPPGLAVTQQASGLLLVGRVLAGPPQTHSPAPSPAVCSHLGAAVGAAQGAPGGLLRLSGVDTQSWTCRLTQCGHAYFLEATPEWPRRSPFPPAVHRAPVSLRLANTVFSFFFKFWWEPSYWV